MKVSISMEEYYRIRNTVIGTKDKEVIGMFNTIITNKMPDVDIHVNKENIGSEVTFELSTALSDKLLTLTMLYSKQMLEISEELKNGITPFSLGRVVTIVKSIVHDYKRRY